MKMSISSDEKFDSEVWWVLQEIQTKYLATPKEQPPPAKDEYIHVIKPHGVKIWLHYGDEFNQRQNIIYKLQDWGALKVLDETRGDFNWRWGDDEHLETHGF